MENHFSLADDRSLVIAKAGNGSCAVVWDRHKDLLKAGKQLGDEAVYKNGSFNEKILSGLMANSHKIFYSLGRKRAISENEMKFLVYDYINATILGKLYSLPKIHKRHFKIPGSPIISNCTTSTEKTFEFLDHGFKLVMQSSWSYTRLQWTLQKKIKKNKKRYLPENSTLVTTDVVAQYP